LNISDYLYIGIYQPRQQNYKNGRNRLAQKIYKYLNNDASEEKELLNLQYEINQILDKYEGIIYSEEMILHTPKWEVKLKRLYALFCRYDLRIAFCYRPATEVLPSYYAETLNYLPQKLKNDPGFFFQSKWVDIYNPELIYKKLQQLGFRHVNLFMFTDLVNNKLSLNLIFEVNNKTSPWDTPIVLFKKKIKNLYLQIQKREMIY